MKPYSSLILTLALLMQCVAATAEVTTTETNNGNLVMQDVPAIRQTGTLIREKVYITNI